MRKLILTAALAATVLLAACGKDETVATADPAATAAKQAYEKTIRDWRNERVQRLQKVDGWLSLVGMHWIEVGTSRVGTNPKFNTPLAVGPSLLGMLTLTKDGTLSFRPESDAGVTIDGVPATGPTRLVSDADAGPDAGPTVVGFNQGDASFIVIKRGGRYAMRVRNAMAATRTGFTGIDYFPIDQSFRFQAKFTPHPAGQKIDIVNILSQVEPMDNPGTVTFEKDGKSYTLEAVDEGDHQLFLIYADRTSGHESYAAARFLYADYPGADGTTVVDFNKGYNPPCAFTPYSTCPMPPLSNRLDLAITAGEKKPRKLGAAVAQ
ncbi:DUF1684 domain-containing protein [Arenimonas oryziterrae]|uniref:DUF1684 domain-containing protein n=1 Tax=Arenimonas oryziterrae DSM 21050 = YC6267 TaxID=1121015 RepID=A0A091B9M6_9GAMM|nr:DUF1684 domain-containing protein [Arenimonas oryziterrae]KFN41160.1 hypothetical protein N789_04545 [Arenimonas oryziterrae DSM 21050 = YC6267]